MAEPHKERNTEAPEPMARPVGGTEYSWCKAVPTGTGITVLALLLSKHPNIQLLRTALNNLQNNHPILRSKLHSSADAKTFSFITPPEPHILIQQCDISSTSQTISDKTGAGSPFQLILEHELNRNTWTNPSHQSNTNSDSNLFYVSIYTPSETQWVVTLRLHTSICDRASAVAVSKELLRLMTGRDEGGIEKEYDRKGEVSLGIEEFIPSGKANKPFWARGVDMLGYSLNSLRLSNISFVDADSPRFSQVLRLQLNRDETGRLVEGCKSRGIKLCGALAAAGLIAARSTKYFPSHQREKYAVVTLVDCRSILEPVLSDDYLGFYHSAILNTHDVNGEEELWELATRSYTSFANAKNSDKHFTDMNDLNFLMCKAIDNPGLTPASSLRTAVISVFEDPIVDETNKLHQEIGLEDYIGCSSVHGVGPSIAIFDTIRDGWLDCACVYPSPLHSREQLQQLIDDMKKILVEGGSFGNGETGE